MCWTTFVSSSLLTFALMGMLVYNQWDQRWNDAIRVHSFEYFLMCMLGGVFSGALPHTLLTPVDLIKCRTQVGEYSGFSDGYHHIHVLEARGQWLASIPLFFRGWAPTLVGYSLQGSLKFGLYELFKFSFDGGVFSHEFALAHKVTVYLFASCCAELLADIALSPWEAVKVKMQTTRTYPPKLNIVVPRMWAAEGIHAFFKGLAPLWARQVPYTMMKFASFEKIVELLYVAFAPGPKSEVPKTAQIALSLIAGFLAGVLCAAVSHPADTVVSKLNQRTEKTGGSSVWSFVAQLGCKELWRGIVLRLVMIGTLTAIQWVIYDSFKVMVGLPTTGGAHPSPNTDRTTITVVSSLIRETIAPSPAPVSVGGILD
jgi:solute carrier family 25 phosphate transporter 3